MDYKPNKYRVYRASNGRIMAQMAGSGKSEEWYTIQVFNISDYISEQQAINVAEEACRRDARQDRAMWEDEQKCGVVKHLGYLTGE